MQFIRGDFSIKTNLNENNYANILDNNIWKIGTISDNPGIDEETDDNYYTTVENKDVQDNASKTRRAFKNKVSVKLYDGTEETGHLIHWVNNRSNGWFAITKEPWWDNFDEKGAYIGN